MSVIGLQLLPGISSAASRLTLLAIFSLGIVLVVLVPYVLDVWNAHHSWRALVTANPSAVKDAPAPAGIQGLARAVMALTLIVAIAFGLGYVLVEHPFANSNTIVSNILVALTTALASITAFYFGNRAAAEAQEAAQAAQTAQAADASGTGKPIVTIRAPADGASFAVGQVVKADYSATPSAGAQITRLTGPVDSGSPIDTSTTGSHEFTVAARDTAGLEARATTSYTVSA